MKKNCLLLTAPFLLMALNASILSFDLFSLNGPPLGSTSGRRPANRPTEQWETTRTRILAALQEVMGPLPNAGQKIAPAFQLLREDTVENVRRLSITYLSEKDDRVPAYLLVPQELSLPMPAILCLHQTTETGKGEPAGVSGSANLHYALELANRGYVTLAPDYPNFGDYTYDPYQHGYQSATMKGIWNHMAAIDLLQSLSEVDPERIGCIGHSLGGHNSLFVAAFDRRIKAVVSSCGFNSFFKYNGGDLTGWSHRGYMPRIAFLFDKEPAKMPFDFSDVLSAIAPRAVFINAPLRDDNFRVEGVYDCVKAAKPVYTLFQASDKLVMVNPDTGHDFPPEIREAAYQFLDKELKGPTAGP